MSDTGMHAFTVYHQLLVFCTMLKPPRSASKTRFYEVSRLHKLPE